MVVINCIIIDGITYYLNDACADLKYKQLTIKVQNNILL